MAHMQPQVIKGDWWEIDGNLGTSVFPADFFTCKEARNAYEGDRIDGETYRKGWYGARFSAPGYLDCTEWALFDTEEAAEQYLAEQDDSDEEEAA